MTYDEAVNAVRRMQKLPSWRADSSALSGSWGNVPGHPNLTLTAHRARVNAWYRELDGNRPRSDRSFFPYESHNAGTAMTPDQLKAFRKARKWTQKQLASELGVGLRTIVRWEHGEARIPQMVAKLLTPELSIEK